MVSSLFWGLSLHMVFWEAELENFCRDSGVLFLYKYLLLVLPTCHSLWCGLSSADLLLVRIVHDHRACLGSILNMLLDKWAASAQGQIWLQNVNGRTKMAYQVSGTFLKQGQSSFKAALKREALFCTSLTPSLWCTDAAPLKMKAEPDLPNLLSGERQEICCPR